MKKLIYVSMAVLMVLIAVSCEKEPKPGKKVTTPEAVDIGMVVNGHKVLWASFNLGASKEWEYGNYYSWGELKTKKDYGEEAYTYKDNPVFLPLEKDVANVMLKGNWRMPTMNEFEALLALKNRPGYIVEKHAEVKDDRGNVIYGLKITQESTNNSVFFPATGLSVGTEIGKFAGSVGYYWSSSIDTEFLDSSYVLDFNSKESSVSTVGRSLGLAVRPVLVE